MGSCISCKSGGRAQSYTTINMESEKIGETTSSLSRSTVYARNNNVDSFGFRRRIPSALKSLSQERTSELVQNYENKIANINSKNTSGNSSSKSRNVANVRLNTNNRTLSSNIPRYGSKIPNSFSLAKSTNDTKSLSNSSLSLDSNCNTVTEDMTPETCNSLTNGTQGHRLRGKTKVHDMNRPHSKHSNCFVSSSDHKQQTNEASNHIASLNRPKTCDGDQKPKARTRNASHSATSGLPRPQTLNISNKGAIAARNSIMKNNFLTDGNKESPLAKEDDTDIMHVSSDTLPEVETPVAERAPVPGTSVQERSVRIDAGSDKPKKTKPASSQCQNGISNNGKTHSIPTRKPSSKTIEANQKKKPDNLQAKSNIARPKGSQVPTKSNVNSKAGVSSNSLVKNLQRKVKAFSDTKKQASNRDTITKNSNNEPHAKCQEQKVAPKTVIDPKSEFSEENQSAISRNIENTSNNEIEVTCKKVQVKPVANVLTEELPNGRRNEMSSSVDSSGSQQDSSSLQDTGMFSPPSERDQFLIDDEIADQPELLACHPHEYQRILHPSQENFLDQELNLGDFILENTDMCRTHSKETLYSASSINSDDLMLDFDQEEYAAIDAHSHSHAKWPRSRHLKFSTSEVDATSLACSMQMTAAETEDGGMKNDSYSCSAVVQEVGSIKSMLLQLKKTLASAETQNPFDSLTSKNGLFHTLMQNDVPNACADQEGPSDPEQVNDTKNINQENFDLRRQVIFLEQQLVEKTKACRMLQHQLTKRTNETPVSPQKDVCNAATQTDKQRLSLTAVSQSFEDSLNGTTTVSSNEPRSSFQEMNNSSSVVNNGLASTTQVSSPVTRSLNSLISSSNIAKEKCNGASALSERSASAVDLHQHLLTNSSMQPSANNCATKPIGHAKSKNQNKIKLESTSVHSKIAVRNPGKGIPTLKSQPKMCTTKMSKFVNTNQGLTSSLH